MSNLLFSAAWDMPSRTILRVLQARWVGKPTDKTSKAYALYEQGPVWERRRRWYVYTHQHDAVPVANYEVPEIVRLAAMMVEP